MKRLTGEYLAERYGQQSPTPQQWSLLRQGMPGLLNALVDKRSRLNAAPRGASSDGGHQKSGGSRTDGE